MKIILYTKPGCHLCEEALDFLRDLGKTTDLRIESRNIMESEEWFDAYRHRIPVVELPDGKQFCGVRERDELKRAIRSQESPAQEEL